MTIHIITLGKLKEGYWQAAEAEYLKRLGAFVKLQIHELREESFEEKDNPETIKEKEAEKIKNNLEKIKDAYVICLDEHGKQFPSMEFANELKKYSADFTNLIFIIGGPLGLHESILKLAQLKLSFSKMTFTHQMMRIFFLEQIYRSQMIMSNRKYHY